MGFFARLFGRGRSSADGSSPANAIPVRGVPEEYAWARRNLPGYTFEGQALTQIDGRPFDVLKFRAPDGTLREVYFDISSFFGV